MSKKSRLFQRKHPEEINFELQITALIDTLVILVIFMLKTSSMESLETSMTEGTVLPNVFDGRTTGKGPKLIVNARGVQWNQTPYIILEQFSAREPASSPGGSQWQALATAIEATAKSEKDTNAFEGKFFLEADQNTPFPLLNRVLQIAKQYGYKDVQFIGVKYN